MLTFLISRETVMDRYGYLFLSNAVDEVELRIERVQHSFFKNLSDCIRNALYYDSSNKKEKRHYFKILKNSDVVQHIHNISKDCTYGYLYLCLVDDQITLFSTGNDLYHNMLDCVCANKSYMDCDLFKGEQQQYVIKVGYFVLLNDDEIIRELHLPAV